MAYTHTFCKSLLKEVKEIKLDETVINEVKFNNGEFEVELGASKIATFLLVK